MDALQGTMIGVLMSSTLPARLGEPARALVVARRSGRPVENFPVVLGTSCRKTILNIVALIILGVIMFSSVNSSTATRMRWCSPPWLRRRCWCSCWWRR